MPVKGEYRHALGYYNLYMEGRDDESFYLDVKYAVKTAIQKEGGYHGLTSIQKAHLELLDKNMENDAAKYRSSPVTTPKVVTV